MRREKLPVGSKRRLYQKYDAREKLEKRSKERNCEFESTGHLTETVVSPVSFWCLVYNHIKTGKNGGGMDNRKNETTPATC